MVRFLKFTFIMFLALHSFLGVAQAQQQGQKEEAYIASDVTIVKFKPLNRKVKMTREQFEAATVPVVIDTKDDALLSSRIRLPADWTRDSEADFDPAALTDAVLSPVVKYISPIYGDIRGQFSVRAMKLSAQITAENWFSNFAVSEGLSVDGVKIVSEKKVEAQYTRFEDARSYVTRATAVINGNRLLLAEYTLPMSVYAQFRDQQIWSVLSFQLTSPSSSPVEPYKSHSFLGVMSFVYPQSWLVKAPEAKNTDRFSAEIISTSRDINRYESQVRYVKLEGKMDVIAVSKSIAPDIKPEIAKLKQGLDKKGLVLGKLLRKIKPKLQKDVHDIETNVYLLEDKNKKLQNYEYAIALLENKDYYLIISALAPLQENDFLGWARNREAFKTVVESIK